MAHPVKCFYCGSTFDRDKEAFVAIPNKAKRYAHELCYKRATQEEEQQKKDKETYNKKLCYHNKVLNILLILFILNANFNQTYEVFKLK